MTESSQRPNVLCFVLDQLRYDHLGCTGNEVIDTPNVDELAARGVSFDRAYVSNPLCMPARATLFTGRPPRNHGVRTNGIPLDPDLPTLPGLLADAGYRTHAAGKLHLRNYGAPTGTDAEDLDPSAFPECRELWEAGRLTEFPEPYYGLETVDFTGGHVDYVFGEYREWLEARHPESVPRLSMDHPANESRPAPDANRWSLPEEHHYNRWIADRARDFLRAEAGEDPFFLWCSFPDPHHPFAVPEPWDGRYDPEEVPGPVRREGELEDLPPFYRAAYEEADTQLSGLAGSTALDEDALREQIAITYGMVSFVDREIGRVLAVLDAEGLREDTVVVFLSDHGDMMGDHWMLRKGPFHFEGLLRVPFVWSYPGTFPEGVRTDGLASHLDLLPTLLDLCDVPAPAPPSGEGEAAPPAFPGSSLRPQLTGEAERVADHVIVENDEDYLGLRVRTYVTERYKLTIYPGREYGELYDLAEDPDELHNRWGDPEYREVEDRLYREFLEAYVEGEPGLPRRLSHA